MSTHVVDVGFDDLRNEQGALAALDSVSGDRAALLIMVREAFGHRRAAELVKEIGFCLYLAGKVSAFCRFVRLSITINPEVPPGKLRIVLLPADAPDAGGTLTPLPTPLPASGAREQGGADGEVLS